MSFRYGFQANVLPGNRIVVTKVSPHAKCYGVRENQIIRKMNYLETYPMKGRGDQASNGTLAYLAMWVTDSSVTCSTLKLKSSLHVGRGRVIYERYSKYERQEILCAIKSEDDYRRRFITERRMTRRNRGCRWPPNVVDLQRFHAETLSTRSVVSTNANGIAKTNYESSISPLSPTHNEGIYNRFKGMDDGEVQIGPGMIAGALAPCESHRAVKQFDDRTRLESIAKRCALWPVGDSRYYKIRKNANGIAAELNPDPQVRIALQNVMSRDGFMNNLPEMLSKLNLNDANDLYEAKALIGRFRRLIRHVFVETVMLLWDKRFWISLSSHGLLKNYPTPKKVLTWCDALLVRCRVYLCVCVFEEFNDCVMYI